MEKATLWHFVKGKTVKNDGSHDFMGRGEGMNTLSTEDFRLMKLLCVIV